MPLSHEQLFRIGAKVFQKAGTDPTFRALALKDGSAAVEQVIGQPLPDGVKIRFVENNGATVTLGLPPVRVAGELSDHELEAVAGGRDDAQAGSEAGAQLAEAAPEMVAAALGRE
jgi:hypothetical protein